MSERILVCVAWPYANGPLHLGHIAGCYLPADIFARYHRLKGNQVLMVSGSDQHGTPIVLKADEEGRSPQEIVDRYHKSFLESWERLGISFDLFTTTGTTNHRSVTHDMFFRLRDRGYIYEDSMPQAYCPRCLRFLPDRYVVGTCPHCASPRARGDQCEQCGKPLNPEELVEPRCRICATLPEIRMSRHFFLRLSAFGGQLLAWLKDKSYWRPNVLNFTQRYVEEGLKDRAITRDIEWGVSVPVEGWESKRIYVWFEAVIGYLSATQEWAQIHGQDWRPFWQPGEVKTYHFIGKDNIPFHTIIWPAMLMGYGGIALPYDVPANEFLTIEGRKLSTSQNWAVWVPDYLERYAPDPLRYYLSAIMPETGDADFSWREFWRRNNDELVATYGNLVHRVLTFTYKHFDGAVPVPGELDAASNALLRKAEETLSTVDEQLRGCHFKDALRTAMGLAQDANRYLEDQSPWKAIARGRELVATPLYTAITVISCLKTALCPFLPFSSQKLHSMLGFTGEVTSLGWRLVPPPPGQRLARPEPLFAKLEEDMVAQETARLGAG